MGEATTYYNRPMLKKPTWKWFIPFYMFIGGLGGGVALIGGLADIFGGKRHRATVRRARYIALVVALISPLLLILDLGRPRASITCCASSRSARRSASAPGFCSSSA